MFFFVFLVLNTEEELSNSFSCIYSVFTLPSWLFVSQIAHFLLFVSICRLFTKLLEAGHQKSLWLDGTLFFLLSNYLVVKYGYIIPIVYSYTWSCLFPEWICPLYALYSLKCWFIFLIFFIFILFPLASSFLWCWIANWKLQSIIGYWTMERSYFPSILGEDI